MRLCSSPLCQCWRGGRAFRWTGLLGLLLSMSCMQGAALRAGAADNDGFKAPAAPGEHQGLRHQRSSGSDVGPSVTPICSPGPPGTPPPVMLFDSQRDRGLAGCLGTCMQQIADGDSLVVGGDSAHLSLRKSSEDFL